MRNSAKQEPCDFSRGRFRIGNPNKFAIITQSIKEWNSYSDTFYNGVLLFCINGKILPNDEIGVATLSYEIRFLKDYLQSIEINKDIYSMPKYDAFLKMYNLTYNDDGLDIEPKYNFNIAPVILSDNDYLVFAVSNGKKVRIISSNKLKRVLDTSYRIKIYTTDLKSVKKKNLTETFITIEELNKIISQLKIYE